MLYNGTPSIERSFLRMVSSTTSSASGSIHRWKRLLTSEVTQVESCIWLWAPMALRWQVLLQMKLCASGKCSNRLRIRKNQLSCPQDRHAVTTQGWKWIRLTKKCAREAPLTSSWLTTHRYFKLHLLSSTGSAWDEGFINFDWRTLIPSLKAFSSYSLELSMKFNFKCWSCHHTPLHTLSFSWCLSLCVCKITRTVWREVTAILR